MFKGYPLEYLIRANMENYPLINDSLVTIILTSRIEGMEGV
jgi:hypothetical protein